MGKRERASGVIAGVLLVLLLPIAAEAGLVESTLSPGLVAAAEYRAGRNDRPAVLLLHGFLQTRDSPPLNRLADSLADAGYSVLVPTLSLKVTRRAKSLQCEAVHQHTQGDDLKELAYWVDWLAARTQRGVVLVGHSSGGKDVLAYLSGKPNAKVRSAILVSVGPVYIDMAEFSRVQAEKAPDPGIPAPLRRFTMAYCKGSYMAPAPAYLSYAAWTGDRIVEGLNRLKLPAEIILGGNDQVFEPGWAERLKTTRVPVTAVAGAGHFFDGEHEFTLYDRVNEVLSRMRN